MNKLLEKYEDEILVRMFQKELIGIRYTSIERVASKIKWQEIASEYRIKRSFQSVMRRLINLQLVTDHGKSGKVASLTIAGVEYVKGLK